MSDRPQDAALATLAAFATTTTLAWAALTFTSVQWTLAGIVPEAIRYGVQFLAREGVRVFSQPSYLFITILVLWILPGALIRLRIFTSDSPRGDWTPTASGPLRFRWTNPVESQSVVVQPRWFGIPVVWAVYRYDHGDAENWTLMEAGGPWDVTEGALTWMDNLTFFNILGVVESEREGDGREAGRGE